MGQIISEIDQFGENRVTKPKIPEDIYAECKRILEIDASKIKSMDEKTQESTQESTSKRAHKLFAKELSGNGMYQTFSNNSNKRKSDNPEKEKPTVNKLKKGKKDEKGVEDR
jgi:hypothetical protein